MTTIVIAAVGVVFGVLGVGLGLRASRRAASSVRQCTELVHGAVGSHGTVDPRALRDVGIVRYDALNEMSGQLSFSLALLNATGDGVVLSSINGRAETRTYAKPVVAGQGKPELSPEEAQAVQSARLGTGLSAVVPVMTARAATARPDLIGDGDGGVARRYGMMGHMRYAYLGPEGTFTEAAVAGARPAREPDATSSRCHARRSARP